MKSTKMFTIKEGEIFIPKKTMDMYKDCNDDDIPLNSDRQLLRDKLKDDHPEVYDLINRVTRFASPLVFSPTEDLLLNLVFGPTIEYLQSVNLMGKECAYRELTEKLLRNLPSVFNYAVYAATSGERMEAINTHWDASSMTMRDWVKKYDVNKIIVTHRPVTTTLNDLQLGYLSSRLVFNRKEMRDLLHASLEYRSINVTSYHVTHIDSDIHVGLANDVANALTELRFLHPGIEEVTDRLTTYLGFEIGYGEVSLVDFLLTDAYSCFLVTYKLTGVRDAYQAFIRSLAKGLESTISFSVIEEHSQDRWMCCVETYNDFRSRHVGKTLSIQYSEDIDNYIKENYVFSILPFVMTRKDMVSLSMPVAGFDIVIQGNSMIKDRAI
jgi:hypothetical protein